MAFHVAHSEFFSDDPPRPPPAWNLQAHTLNSVFGAETTGFEL